MCRTQLSSDKIVLRLIFLYYIYNILYPDLLIFIQYKILVHPIQYKILMKIFIEISQNDTPSTQSTMHWYKICKVCCKQLFDEISSSHSILRLIHSCQFSIYLHSKFNEIHLKKVSTHWKYGNADYQCEKIDLTFVN